MNHTGAKSRGMDRRRGREVAIVGVTANGSLRGGNMSTTAEKEISVAQTSICELVLWSSSGRCVTQKETARHIRMARFPQHSPRTAIPSLFDPEMALNADNLS